MAIELTKITKITIKEGSSVLFLDDSPIRIGKFLSRIPFATTVQTAKECIEKLQEREWDLVSLDHDLSGEIHVDSNREDCGMEVVRWVQENKPKVENFIVHSLNIYAAEQMKFSLDKYGYDVAQIPFICLDLSVGKTGENP